MWMQSLANFIKKSQDKREIQRATAVKMLLCGYKHEEIMPILGVSSGFISTWKKAFFKNGIDGLKLGYKGSKGLLNEMQRGEVIEWLQTKQTWTLNELEYHIAAKYGVTFASKQSYYDLFEAARIRWKKAQAHNPKHDPDKVALKKKLFVSYWHRDEPK
jgi:putative transposase